MWIPKKGRNKQSQLKGFGCVLPFIPKLHSYHLSARPCSEWKLPLSVVKMITVLSSASCRLTSSNMAPIAESTSVAIPAQDECNECCISSFMFGDDSKKKQQQ